MATPPDVLGTWTPAAATQAGASKASTTPNLLDSWIGKGAPVTLPALTGQPQFMTGLKHGAEGLVTGARELWNSTGGIDRWVANHLPVGAFKDFESQAAAHEDAREQALRQKAQAQAQAYAQNPVSQTLPAKLGSFLAQTLPFAVAPEARAAEGAGLIERLAVPLAGNALTGTELGAVEPVGPGQSRVGNMVAMGIGGAAGGAAAKASGAVARVGSELVAPPIARAIGKREAAETLLKAAPELKNMDRVRQIEEKTQALQDAVPGLAPDLAGVTRNARLASLTRSIAQRPGQEAYFLDATRANQQAIQSRLGALGNTAAPTTDVAAAVGNTLNAAHDAANARAEALWNDKHFLQTPVNISRLEQNMSGWRDSLPVSDRDSLPSWPFNHLHDIVEKYGPEAPLNEIKSLRSNILRAARREPGTPESFHLTGMADELLNNLGNGQLFTKPEAEAGSAYRAATNATRELHEDFAPLRPALNRGVTAQSQVAPWLMNVARPVPERLDQYLAVGQKYLNNAGEAPQAARDYFINILANAVKPATEARPIPSGKLERLVQQNWPTIQKLYPDKGRQTLIRHLVDAAKTAEFTSAAKVEDRGSDTAQKLLGNAWLSENLGHGVHLGGLWSRLGDWLLNLPEQSRVQALSEALRDPKIAAKLAKRYSPEVHPVLRTGLHGIAKGPKALLPAAAALGVQQSAQPINQ